MFGDRHSCKMSKLLPCALRGKGNSEFLLEKTKGLGQSERILILADNKILDFTFPIWRPLLYHD